MVMDSTADPGMLPIDVYDRIAAQFPAGARIRRPRISPPFDRGVIVGFEPQTIRAPHCSTCSCDDTERRHPMAEYVRIRLDVGYGVGMDEVFEFWRYVAAEA